MTNLKTLKTEQRKKEAVKVEWKTVAEVLEVLSDDEEHVLDCARVTTGLDSKDVIVAALKYFLKNCQMIERVTLPSGVDRPVRLPEC